VVKFCPQRCYSLTLSKQTHTHSHSRTDTHTHTNAHTLQSGIEMLTVSPPLKSQRLVGARGFDLNLVVFLPSYTCQLPATSARDAQHQSIFFFFSFIQQSYSKIMKSCLLLTALDADVMNISFFPLLLNLKLHARVPDALERNPPYRHGPSQWILQGSSLCL